MEAFWNYIIEAGLTLGLFTLVYMLLLRRENRLVLNRLYLLFALLFSTLRPMFSFSFFENMFKNDIVYEAEVINAIAVYASAAPSRLGSWLYSIESLNLLYLVGTLISFGLVLVSIRKLIFTTIKSRVFNLKQAKLVLLQGDTDAYSFLHYIFINREINLQKGWKSIVYHEAEHLKQFHALDLIVVNLILIFQWFNPFYWVIRSLIRENHEYLADLAVLKKNRISRGKYKQLMLNQAIGGYSLVTSSFFNNRLIKKRFKMIANNKKTKLSIVKYLMSITLLLSVGVLISSYTRADNVIIPEVPDLTLGSAMDTINNDDVFIRVEQMPTFNGGKPEVEFRKYIAKNTKYPVVALKKNIQGEVIIKFTVNTDGSISDEQVLRSVDPLLDAEALRVVKSSPIWEAGVQRGKKVRVTYTFPISFKLQKSPAITNPDGSYRLVEQMPTFNGGEPETEFVKYIKENIKYPDAAIKKSIRGFVAVKFIVNVDGSISDTKILKGVDPLLDAEALRVIQSSPKWKPGMNNGKKVRVTYIFPVSFGLDNQEITFAPPPPPHTGKSNDKGEVFMRVEQMPTFNGGKPEIEFRKYIGKSTIYPPAAVKSNIQGQVIVKFIVNTDGSVSDIQILQGVDPLLDAEAKRVIASSPKWVSGEQRGEKVRVTYTFPIAFSLGEKEKNVVPPPPPPPSSALGEVVVVSYGIEEKQNLPTEDEWKDATSVYKKVEQMPTFNGGKAEVEFRKYIANNVTYPSVAVKNGIKGVVVVKFTVNTDGTVSDEQILKGVDPSLDAESLRVIKSSPKWEPGMDKGKKVRVTYTFPITYSLQ